MTPQPSMPSDPLANGPGEVTQGDCDSASCCESALKKPDRPEAKETFVTSPAIPQDEQKIDVCEFAELAPSDLVRWEQIRAMRKDFEPPFFAARFAAAVNSVRGDVLTAVFRSSNNEPLGYLPFHRVGGVGVPAGRFLNDAQNVIAIPGLQVDWAELARAAKVRAFNLHAIVGSEADWIERYQLKSVNAFRADLGDDSGDYLKRLEKEHRTIGKQGQKTRKLGREIGPVRLELDCRCPEILKQTIAWKRAQYQRTHILDLFLPDWTRDLITLLHENSLGQPGLQPDSTVAGDNFSNDSLRGICSVLWAGDTPVATHIGMIEHGRLHYWFPTYDPAFARYSPGTALFTEILRAATPHGIHCVDMGYGEQPYKKKQTGTTTQVVHGTITHSRWHRMAFAAEATLVQALRRVPMKETVKRAIRTINPSAGIKKLK
ncbi:MAG: GNAT family N-acetyltransferase [Rhodopirellula bahusiensis]|uniref:GNAT family N-acetyltransferase n=3 Tax=Rhodopirellula bahusiensis TaxID=2014065 RepID=UPI0032642A9B